MADLAGPAVLYQGASAVEASQCWRGMRWFICRYDRREARLVLRARNMELRGPGIDLGLYAPGRGPFSAAEWRTWADPVMRAAEERRQAAMGSAWPVAYLVMDAPEYVHCSVYASHPVGPSGPRRVAASAAPLPTGLAAPVAAGDLTVFALDEDLEEYVVCRDIRAYHLPEARFEMREFGASLGKHAGPRVNLRGRANDLDGSRIEWLGFTMTGIEHPHAVLWAQRQDGTCALVKCLATTRLHLCPTMTDAHLQLPTLQGCQTWTPQQWLESERLRISCAEGEFYVQASEHDLWELPGPDPGIPPAPPPHEDSWSFGQPLWEGGPPLSDL